MVQVVQVVHVVRVAWVVRVVLVIKFVNAYGLYGLNSQIIEKTCDVTPVTHTHTDAHRKVEQNPQYIKSLWEDLKWFFHLLAVKLSSGRRIISNIFRKTFRRLINHLNIKATGGGEVTQNSYFSKEEGACNSLQVSSFNFQAYI